MRTRCSPRPWFAAAAVVSTACCALHTIAGGHEAVRPLMAAAALDQTVRFTLYYCWHLVTIAIAWLAVAFALAAVGRDARTAAHATILSATFAAWDLLMIALHGLSPITHGQWILFLTAAASGATGLALCRPSRTTPRRPA